MLKESCIVSMQSWDKGNKMNIIKIREQGNSLELTFEDGSKASCPKVDSNIEYELAKEWLKVEGNTIEPEFTEVELSVQAKQQAEYLKTEALSKLTVTTSSGKVFYADTESRVDLSEAIKIGERDSKTSTMWKLAEEFEGQRVTYITLDEAREASELALYAKGSLVGITS